MSTRADTRTDLSRVTSTKTAPTFQAAPVDTYADMPLYEHYNVNGYLLLITSDPAAIELEPGDFVVKRDWRTNVVPYVHHEYLASDDDTDEDTDELAEPFAVGFLSTTAHLPCQSIQCAICFPGLAANLAKANAAMSANL